MAGAHPATASEAHPATASEAHPATASEAHPATASEAQPATASEAPPARLRPGRVWYWVALLVFVAGWAWFVLGLVLLNGRIDSFQRVAVPGSGEVSLDHSGEYVIYYEGLGAAEGNIPPFDVTVNPAAAPAAVQSLDVHSGVGMSYSFGAREGRAVLTLEVAQPGTFVIETTTDTPAVCQLARGRLQHRRQHRGHRRAERRGQFGGDRGGNCDCHRPSIPGQARPVASSLRPALQRSSPLPATKGVPIRAVRRGALDDGHGRTVTRGTGVQAVGEATLVHEVHCRSEVPDR